MNKRRTAVLASVAALGMLLTGCSSSATATDPAEEVKFPVAEEITLEGSATLDAAVERGKIVIGVKEDQPGFGVRDSATGIRSGFDIDLSRWIAAELGFGTDVIEFVTIPSQSREQALTNGDADLIIGMYTISEKRKEMVGFAGPYMTNGQSILVRSDNTDIKGEDDLAGHKVCSITGSTPMQYIKENHPDVEPVEFDNMAQCVDALVNGQVDAVTTDEALLIGYTTLDPENLKVVGKPFTHEGFGIGVNLEDVALRHFVNDLLVNKADVLQSIYDDNLGSSGVAFQTAEVDNY
ncbi:glutamate ABC transporter substrate-binding protein [Cryobacterium sp. BB307]|uniref:glutamate ABC transporter substrate-binding protein n=1 Tax=Cryobacterium sp. BB307 TaxID=2716317 RepID=UPI00144682C4|nr:glutamate ABC transporter substrate-binding protein [Cryobacterium sp. BB307]